jgi:nucleoside-diphosphate-sugar epimerase
MSVLITGATGLVGFTIARELVAKKYTVRALVRSESKQIPEGVERVLGDVTDADSVRRAVEGAKYVVHAAGLPEQWMKDPAELERVNVGGTQNVLDAALAAKVERLLYVSTIDVFAAENGAEYDESVIDPVPKATAYERSKQEADRRAVSAIERGLAVVFIHPSAVYGPAPAGSPGLNDLIQKIEAKKAPLVPPGGMPVVFGPDLGKSAVLALERAPSGARYILSERFYTTKELSAQIARALGRDEGPPAMPLWLAKLVSGVTEGVAALTGLAPLLPAGQLHFLQWGAKPNAAKAKRELEFAATPFEEGVKQTLAWMRS